MTSDNDSVVRVVALWRAAAGHEQQVRDILHELAPTTQREPGCHGFEVLESTTAPGSFVLIERYAGTRAHSGHLATAHFNALVLQQAVPILAHRDVQTYHVLVPDAVTQSKGAQADSATQRKGRTKA